MKQTIVSERPRPLRSEDLLPDERRAFSKKVKSFATKYDAALFFGFSRVTLDRVLSTGKAKGPIVSGIREKISTAA